MTADILNAEDVRLLKSEPEIGKTYLVQTIRNAKFKEGIIPVIAPAHNDAEFGFGSIDHFHTDFRFLCDEDMNYIRGRIAEESGKHDYLVRSLLDDNCFCIAAGAGDELSAADFASATETLWAVPLPKPSVLDIYDLVFYKRWAGEDHVIQLRPMVCRRRMPLYNKSSVSPLDILETEFSKREDLARRSCYVSGGVRMDPKKLVCPHRGAHLASMPDARTKYDSACVTCPQHGLSWELFSGKMVKFADLAR